MARRLEIELTSARPDGTWTWRAAGALNPRGYLDGSLLYDGAKVGDVVRAEADFSLEGITVVAVEPPRLPEGPDPNVISLVERALPAGVTTQLAAQHRPARERANGRAAREPMAEARHRPGEHAGDRPARQGEAGGRRQRLRRDGEARRERPLGAERSGGRPRSVPGQKAGLGGAACAPHPEAEGPSTGGPTRPSTGTGARRGDERATKRPEGEKPEHTSRPSALRARATSPDHDPQSASERGRQRRRLSPANVHRNALLDSLPPEHRPIAQQLMRGGIPAVRTALYFERERAREEGRPEPSTEGVLAIAESLAGRVKAAEWRDRAEAALRAGDDLLTRDLRSLVTSSDIARDAATRELAAALKDMLERRVEVAREAWTGEVGHLLDQGQVAKALHLSAQPPDAAARLSADLAVRLRDAAGEALNADLAPRRWLELLVAVSESPVRRAVKPKGIPSNASPELLEAAHQQCGRVPGLAPLLGIAVPPPPGPLVRPKRLPKAPAHKRGRAPGSRHVSQPAERTSSRGEAQTKHQAPAAEAGEEPTSTKVGAPAAEQRTAEERPVEAADERTAEQAPAEAPAAEQTLAEPVHDAPTAEEVTAKELPAEMPATEDIAGSDIGEPAVLSSAGGASPATAL